MGGGGASFNTRTAEAAESVAAVHVRVDVPGHHGRALELHVGGAWRCTRPDVRDLFTLDVHPPRREDPRRGDHTTR